MQLNLSRQPGGPAQAFKHDQSNDARLRIRKRLASHLWHLCCFVSSLHPPISGERAGPVGPACGPRLDIYQPQFLRQLTKVKTDPPTSERRRSECRSSFPARPEGLKSGGSEFRSQKALQRHPPIRQAWKAVMWQPGL